MSCSSCIHNGRKSCDPDPAGRGCSNHQSDWKDEEIDTEENEYDDDDGKVDVFETLNNAFKPVKS
jgi:hypothetical protein